MKALNLYSVGDLRYDDIPIPVIKDDEVLLKIKAVGICGSDIPRVFEKGTYHFPTVIGHEFAGKVVKAHNRVLLNKKAAVFPLIPCGKCAACKTGKYAQCDNYDYYGSRRNGAMSEYLAVKENNLVFIPDGISYDAAAMCEPASVALHAFKKTRVVKNDALLIWGIGPIAMIIAQLARAAGLKNIILVARSDERVKFAQKMGFPFSINTLKKDLNKFVDSLTNNKGVDACVEGTGTASSLEGCLSCVKNFGTIVAMGNPVGSIELSQQAYWKILRKELSLVGTWNSNFNNMENDWKEVISAISKNIIQLEPLITHRFTLQEYQNAFSLMKEKKEFYCKVMFINK
ncbi:galactitol-1-phosphate 5-dehydrogenase [Pectinatus frisingensis]|jgi:L-iditol 2-dehydrogenase|uniref:galactitol-1-phosphate 5-dehydrogenase n=1 Tax=Pectinatus frisingensis TaxID=865 RepID=UPI0018C5BF8A|nr:galactitol-1-phosphate 5-dehydrogenase [Pectinatus frisingensis]